MKIRPCLLVIASFILLLFLSCATSGRTERQVATMETARAHMQVGMAFLQNEDFGNALIELQRAYSTIKDDPVLLNALGLAHKGLQQDLRAEEFFNAAIQTNPDYYESYNNLGILFAETGNYPKAIKMFKTLLESRDYSTPELAHFNLAIIYTETQQTGKAIQELLKAIALEPSFMHSYLHLGILYRDTGQYDKALSIFRRAITIQPDLPQFIYNKAIVHEMQNETEKALSLYQEALNHPNCPMGLARDIRRRMLRLGETDNLFQ